MSSNLTASANKHLETRIATGFAGFLVSVYPPSYPHFIRCFRGKSSVFSPCQIGSFQFSKLSRSSVTEAVSPVHYIKIHQMASVLFQLRWNAISLSVPASADSSRSASHLLVHVVK